MLDRQWHLQDWSDILQFRLKWGFEQAAIDRLRSWYNILRKDCKFVRILKNLLKITVTIIDIPECDFLFLNFWRSRIFSNTYKKIIKNFHNRWRYKGILRKMFLFYFCRFQKAMKIHYYFFINFLLNETFFLCKQIEYRKHSY